MILEHAGQNVYADRVYTYEELKEIKAGCDREAEAANVEIDRLAAELEKARERLAEAEKSGEWVIKALVELETAAPPVTAPNGFGGGEVHS